MIQRFSATAVGRWSTKRPALAIPGPGEIRGAAGALPSNGRVPGPLRLTAIAPEVKGTR
jgi:hypothetical protein